MKLQKITLAAIVTFGFWASCNAGFADELVNNLSENILANCSMCNQYMGNSYQEKNWETDMQNADNFNCPTCLPQNITTKNVQKQIYAYPNTIYGNNNVIGENNNGLYVGASSESFSGIPLAPYVDSSITGAAASIPVLNDNYGVNPLNVYRNFSDNSNHVKVYSPTSMKVIRKTLEPVEMSTSTGGAAPLISFFDDVPAGHWASCDINKLTENNIIAGYPDRTFKPDSPISRAEMATLTVKGFNMNTSAEKNFNDVPDSHWADKMINNAVSNNLMDVDSDNNFKPNMPVSKAEALSILSKGINSSIEENRADEILSHYTDGDKVPSWAKIPVAKAINSGALADLPTNNTISPMNDASRAEIASMFENIRISLGYDKNDKVSASCCNSNSKQAFVESEEIVTIPTLELTFNDEISAKSANVGDSFAATTIDEITIGNIKYPAGSTVYGKVTEVSRPSKNNQGGLKLSFNTIKYQNQKSDLPAQVLPAQVNKVHKPHALARLIEFPFAWSGGLIGNVGRTIGGAIVSASNAAEQVVSGIGVGTGELSMGQFKAAGRSYTDVAKAVVKAPVDLTRTALSGTMGIFQYSGDEITYLLDSNGMKVSSVNPKEKVTIAFGCNY